MEVWAQDPYFRPAIGPLISSEGARFVNTYPNIPSDLHKRRIHIRISHIRGLKFRKCWKKNTYLLRSQAIEELLQMLRLMSPRPPRQSMGEVLKGPALQSMEEDILTHGKTNA